MYRHSFFAFAVTALMAFAGATAVPATGNTQTADAHTTIDVANDGVSVVFMAHSAHDLLSLTVRVAGSDGTIVFDQRVEGPMLEWVPEGDLDDGEMFQWEARAVTAIPGAQRLELPDRQGQHPPERNKVHRGANIGAPDVTTIPLEHYYAEADKHVERASGRLQVEDGLLVGPFLPSQSTSFFERIIGSVLDHIVSPAHAATDIADWARIIDSSNDNNTYILMLNDANENWYIENDGGKLQFEKANSAGVIEANRFTLMPGGNLGLGTTLPQDPIHIRHPGPVIRFNDSNNEQTWQLFATEFGYRVGDQTAGTLPFYIQAGAPSDAFRISAGGDIGIGTATPSFPLHVADTLPGIRFDDTNDAQAWLTYVTGRDYVIRDMTNATSPVRIHDGTPSNMLALGPTGASLSLGSLFVEDFDSGPGNVGIGTFSPIVPIHVQRSDGSAKLLVEETSGTTAVRELFELRNNGGPFFIFTNTDLDQSYSFAMGATGHFLISHQQSSGVQFRLKPNGDAQFQGDVTAKGVLLTSSRETKTEFSPVNNQTILEKIAALDVSEWRYKRDPETKRHIGPTAEDFQEVFGLGDGRHISAVDFAGISLAAIKGLKAENETLKAKVAKMDQMESRLETLEKRLAELAR